MNFYGQSIATGGGSVELLDQIIYERYFKDSDPGTAIECGANDGLYLSTCKTFEEIGWKVINIEASPQNFEKLKINRPKSTNINAALSDKNGLVQVDHYDYDNGGMSKLSIEEGCPHIKELTPIISTNINAIRYDFVFHTPIDLFVLDVEGHELKVIDGMRSTTFWPKVFCMEWPHIGLDKITDKLNTVSGNKYVLDFSDSLNAIFMRHT